MAIKITLDALRETLGKAKIWIVRLIALSLATMAVLSGLSIISDAILKPQYFFPAIFTLLWLMFEVQLAVVDKDRKELQEPEVLSWESSLPLIIEAIGKAKQSIYIMGSSSESLFLSLKEPIERCRNVKITVLLRDCKADEQDRLVKLNQYYNYWNKLTSQERKVEVSVKFYSNHYLRGIIIDGSMGFLGFYEYKDEKLWGHSVPLVYVRKSSSLLSDYLLRVYLNRFTQMWEEGSDKPGNCK